MILHTRICVNIDFADDDGEGDGDGDGDGDVDMAGQK